MAILPSQSGTLARSGPDTLTQLDQELVEAYAHCRRVTREASKSFSLATRLLPAPKRQAMEALYAFARTSDDIVDMQDEPPHALEAWIAQVHAAGGGGHPVLPAWADAAERYALPRVLVDELLAGVAMDLSISRYDTFRHLQVYCYRVASVVGLLAMHIIGFRPGAEHYAIQMGTALQLTNVLRDVGEDAARGRIYLPREDLERFGVREEEILQGVQSERFRALMRWEIERAEALYQASWPGIGLLHPDGQMAVAAAAILYRAILPRIAANNYDVFGKRAFVPLHEKLLLLPAIRLRLAALRRGDERLPGLWWPAARRLSSKERGL